MLIGDEPQSYPSYRDIAATTFLRGITRATRRAVFRHKKAARPCQLPAMFFGPGVSAPPDAGALHFELVFIQGHVGGDIARRPRIILSDEVNFEGDDPAPCYCA